MQINTKNPQQKTKNTRQQNGRTVVALVGAFPGAERLGAGLAHEAVPVPVLEERIHCVCAADGRQRWCVWAKKKEQKRKHADQGVA